MAVYTPQLSYHILFILFKNIQKSFNTGKNLSVFEAFTLQQYVELFKDKDLLALLEGEGTDSGSLLVEPVEGTMPEFVKAPVKKGDIICRAKVLYAGNVIKEIDLVASMDVKRGFIATIGTVAKTIFSNWIFRIAAIIIIVVLIILILMKRKRDKAAARSNGKNYRVLNYNDFMKLR